MDLDIDLFAGYWVVCWNGNQKVGVLVPACIGRMISFLLHMLLSCIMYKGPYIYASLCDDRPPLHPSTKGIIIQFTVHHRDKYLVFWTTKQHVWITGGCLWQHPCILGTTAFSLLLTLYEHYVTHKLHVVTHVTLSLTLQTLVGNCMHVNFSKNKIVLQQMTQLKN